MEKVAEEIFKEIEQAIEESKSKVPATIEESKFLKKLKTIKQKYCKNE